MPASLFQIIIINCSEFFIIKNYYKKYKKKYKNINIKLLICKVCVS